MARAEIPFLGFIPFHEAPLVGAEQGTGPYHTILLHEFHRALAIHHDESSVFGQIREFDSQPGKRLLTGARIQEWKAGKGRETRSAAKGAAQEITAGQVLIAEMAHVAPPVCSER
jgi:hypothetical protein